MNRLKSILVVWGIGLLLCGVLTACLVHAAYQTRGYWAIGGEYAPIPLMIVVCVWICDDRKKQKKHDESMTLHPTAKREP